MGDIASQGAPSIENGHYFGLDELGRDLSRAPSRPRSTSLIVGIIGAFVAVVIGTLLRRGLGLCRRRIDNLMMRAVDILIAIPYMFIIILLMVMFERSFFMLFVGIGVVSWLDMSRIVRGQTLSLEEPRIRRGRAGGRRRLVHHHLAPHHAQPAGRRGGLCHACWCR